MAEQPPVDIAAAVEAWTAERLAARRADFEARQARRKADRQWHRDRRNAGLRARHAQRLQYPDPPQSERPASDA